MLDFSKILFLFSVVVFVLSKARQCMFRVGERGIVMCGCFLGMGFVCGFWGDWLEWLGGGGS